MAEQEVIITRTFDAPHGCQLLIYKFDFRPGGVFRYSIQNPGNRCCLCNGIYREIVTPERIVYTLNFSDEQGNLVEPVDIGMDPDWPRETIVSVTFAEQSGKTKLTLHQTIAESFAKRTGAHTGWLQMLDRLAEELAAGEQPHV